MLCPLWKVHSSYGIRASAKINSHFLTEIAGERTNTIVFPLPMDLIDAMINKDKPS